jgi:hypothetical protein
MDELIEKMWLWVERRGKAWGGTYTLWAARYTKNTTAVMGYLEISTEPLREFRKSVRVWLPGWTRVDGNIPKSRENLFTAVPENDSIR